MKIEGLNVGMKVRHLQYGVGIVKTISEHTAEIRFDDGQRTISPEASGIQPAEPQAAVTGLEKPLSVFVQDIVRTAIAELGLEKPDSVVEQLGVRWHKGR